jgi:hypothetical protein
MRIARSICSPVRSVEPLAAAGPDAAPSQQPPHPHNKPIGEPPTSSAVGCTLRMHNQHLLRAAATTVSEANSGNGAAMLCVLQRGACSAQPSTAYCLKSRACMLGSIATSEVRPVSHTNTPDPGALLTPPCCAWLARCRTTADMVVAAKPLAPGDLALRIPEHLVMWVLHPQQVRVPVCAQELPTVPPSVWQ